MSGGRYLHWKERPGGPSLGIPMKSQFLLFISSLAFLSQGSPELGLGDASGRTQCWRQALTCAEPLGPEPSPGAAAAAQGGASLWSKWQLLAPISLPPFFLLEHRAGAPALPGAQTCPAQSEDPMIRSGVNSHAQGKHYV